MSHGGAERVASILCNHWCSQGNKVEIICFESPNTSPHYNISSDVDVHCLDLFQNSLNGFQRFFNIFKRVIRLRKVIKKVKPDVVVSFLTETNILSIIASYKIDAPIIVSERVHPKFHELGILVTFARAVTYKFADELIVQTKGVEDWFRSTLNVKSTVIENPVYKNSMYNVPASQKRSCSNKRLLSAGRLVYQKGFDLLITVFSKLTSEYPDWELYIYGDGNKRRELEQLIRNLGVTDKVFLPGVTSDLSLEMKKSDIFVLSSRYEGFPNVLCEAMSYGLPVLSFDCPDGPSDIIENYHDGLLIKRNDLDEFEKGLRELLSDEMLRQHLSLNAIKINERLNVIEISKKWEKIFHKYTNKL